MPLALFAHGATHRGAPFVGRKREIGILTHLIEDGLSSAWCLVRVAGPPGSGRRRLVAEALRRGPDAEWVQLAPGGTEPDFPRWLNTELLDLIETYPDAPCPSWALHVLARGEPRLRRRARVPAWTRERLPYGSEPEVVGAAVAAVLEAVTTQTQVIVDAGLWPRAGEVEARVMQSLCRRLGGPGAVVIAAIEPDPSGTVDTEGTRTLTIGPLPLEDVTELTAQWGAGAMGSEFAGWLYRVTGGRPYFIHETVRWLEEMGHVRVDDDHGTVELLHPIERLPLPFNLRAVMNARYQRLPSGAALLLDVLAREDGRLEREALRERCGLESEAFEEALATLRRREMLLRRTFRRPVASSGPLWADMAETVGGRRPRQRRPPRERRSRRPPVGSDAPLAHALARLQATTGDNAAALAAAVRVSRGRTGPGWDTLRGRVAAGAARRRAGQGRAASARRWIAWGLAHTSPELHPVLRRHLRRIDAEILGALDRAADSNAVIEAAREESLAAGHLVAAAMLTLILAESVERLGDAARANALAEGLEKTLAGMGLEDPARRARELAERSAAARARADEAAHPLRMAPPPPGLEFDGVALCLLDRPRVVRSGSSWPRALWPGWWLALWCGAAGASLTGRDFARAAAERAVAEAGDAPPTALEGLIVLANQLLRGHETVPGGLHLDGDRLAASWSGIRCDARDLFALADRAERAEGAEAVALARRVLDATPGAYLPGIEGEPHDEIRARLAGIVRHAMETWIAAGEPIDAADHARWLETAGRAGPVAPALAGLSERAGCPRAAFALRRESP